MYIKMDKKKEETQSVWYLFYMDVPGEEYIDSSGSRRFYSVEKQGICIFNKQTGELTIDWDKTDKYYLGCPRELLHMRLELMRRKKLQIFPDILDIATG